MDLLERDRQQKLLDATLAQTSPGPGGEAGIGKTALLLDFVQKHRRGYQVFWGVCDPLFAPRPLGRLESAGTGSG